MASSPVVQTQDSQALEYESYRNDVESFDNDQEFNELFGSGGNDAPDVPAEAVTQETPPKDPVSFNPIETGVPRAVDAVMSFVKGVGKGALETPGQALTGVAEGVNEMLQLAEEAGEKLIDVGLPSSFLQIVDEKGDFDVKLLSPEETTEAREAGDIELFQLPEGADPETLIGTLGRETSKFLFGFLPAVRGVKAIKGTEAAITTFGEASIASAVASAVVQDPHEDRLSAYLNTVPGLSEIIPDYLADNNPANETTWEGRIKNAIEDAAIGLFAEGLFRVFKFYKAQRKTTKLAEAEADPMDRATLKEQARESAEQQVDEVPAGDLSGLGDPEGKTFERIAEAEKRVGAEVPVVKAVDPRAGTPFHKLKDVGDEINPEKLPRLEAFKQEIFAKMRAVKNTNKPILEMTEDELEFIIKDMKKIEDEMETFVLGPTTGKGRSKKRPRSDEDIFEEEDLFLGFGPGTPVHPSESFEEVLKAKTERVGFTEEDMADNLKFILNDLPESPVIDQTAVGFPTRGDLALISLQAIKKEAIARGFSLEEIQNLAMKGFAERFSDPEDAAFMLQRFLKGSLKIEEKVSTSDFIDVEAKEIIPPSTKTVQEAAPIATPSKGKIFINMSRINTEDDIKKLIQDVADADSAAINLKRGGEKKTLGKMLEESDEEFIAVKDLIGRDPGPMSAGEALAARKILASSGEQLAALARRANSSVATPADLYAFRRGMSVHYAIQSEVIAARTETARALRSWAIPVGTDKQRGQAINELIATGGGSKSTKEMAQAIADVADNPTGLNNMVREFSFSTVKKAAFQVWMDGILSGPTTQVVNILGNSITAAYMIPESIANAAVSKVFYDGEISYLEATAKSYGMVKGLRDGFRMLAHGQKAGEFKELEAQFEQFVKFEGLGENNISAEAFGLTNSGAFGQGIDYLGKFFNISAQGLNVSGIPVYPGLNTMDKLFKSMGYRMELEALAIRQGISEGLEGNALAARVVDITNNPPPGMVADSIDAGHYQTFTNEFGETGKAGMQFLKRIPGARLVVTFVRTPANILKFTFKRTPLARYTRNTRADIAAGGARAAQAWGRMGLGSMIMLGVADMTLDGTITGAGPADSRLRSNLMLTGWRPFSVKIGGTYFPYNRLDPVGNLFAYGASVGEIINNTEDPDAELGVSTGVMGFGQTLASKSYLSGIFDFMAAIDPSNPVKGPEEWIQRFSSSLIPKSALLRGIARSIDPKIRITGTAQEVPGIETGTDLFLQETLNKMRSNVPFFSSTLPARVDLWGDDISRASHLGTAWDLLSPIYASEGNYDEVEQILVNNKIPIGHIGKDIQGVKLTGQEQHDYGVLAGKPLKEFLNKLVKQPGFKRHTDGPEGGKSNVIQDHVRRFRASARNQMITNNLSLRNRILAKSARDRSKLTGDPVADPTSGPAQLPVVEGRESPQSIEAILGGRTP